MFSLSAASALYYLFIPPRHCSKNESTSHFFKGGGGNEIWLYLVDLRLGSILYSPYRCPKK